MKLKLSNGKKRLFSGLLLILTVITLIYLGGWYLTGACLVIMLFLVFDVLNAFRHAKFAIVEPLVYAFALLLLPAYLYGKMYGVFLLLLVTCVLTVCVVIFRKKCNFLDAALTIFTLFYPILPMFSLVLITRMTDHALVSIMVIVAVLNASITDIGAYFVGNRFGKRKLCPHISPNKTVEGSIGGFLFAVVFGVVLGLLVEYLYYSALPWYNYAILGSLCGIFAQIGDITASMLKRFTGIKDFGKYIPGQGGALDRLDSVILASVVVYTFLIFMKVG